MEDKKLHIVFKTGALLLLLAVLFPSVVKFVHIFEDHKHEVCTNPSETHFHEVEIDCEFYKFKLNNVFAFAFKAHETLNISVNYQEFYSKYTFLKSFKNIGIVLRGPPNTSPLLFKLV